MPPRGRQPGATAQGEHQGEYFANFARFTSANTATSSRAAGISSARFGVIGCLAMAVATGHWIWLPAAIVCDYGFAWVSHFFFEKNRPATFRHPIYSLRGTG